MNILIGKKINQSQKFLENGRRIPVTKLMAWNNTVIRIFSQEKDGRDAILLGFGEKKHSKKAELGMVKGAKLKKAPSFLKEARLSDGKTFNLGDIIKITDIVKPGDIVNITGVSKGKGYAGVVKRHHFKGGPKTHGQSDRERAPGSIGQTTTPGRVYRGKRMAGKMGQENVTIRNLKVADVDEKYVYILGLVPGSVNSIMILKRVGEDKKFVPVYKEKPESPGKENIQAEIKTDIQVRTVKEEAAKNAK